MKDADIDRVLEATWDDERLARSEQRALTELVADASRPEELRRRLRKRAFALASGFLTEAPSADVLAWLEAVTQTVWPAAQPASGGGAEALFSPDGDICGRIAALFDEARRAVDVCVFTVTDDRIARAMAYAYDRGVKIRLLTDDEKASDLGSDIARLAELGMPVRIDRSAHHMHHKFAVFDRERLLTGSYNWTRSANENNFENVVITPDSDLVRAFSAEFERLWGRAATY